jgi:hypothetical protein
VGHHYVPRFLLREWLADIGGQRVLQGHYYDPYSKKMRVRSRGENFFCNAPNLFTVRGLPDGDDAIERIFFKNLDDAAAISHRMLLRGIALNIRQRVNFVRLILSVEARYPRMVGLIRQRGAQASLSMNSDPEIKKLLAGWGELRPANVVWDELVGFSSEDQAMETVQNLTTNATIGQALAEAPWGVMRREAGCDQLVLGDRPLIRIKGRLPSNNIWIMPISPDVLWFCAMSKETFEQVRNMAPRRFVHLVNGCSAMQSDKYVFGLQGSSPNWLEKRLKRRAGQRNTTTPVLTQWSAL